MEEIEPVVAADIQGAKTEKPKKTARTIGLVVGATLILAAIGLAVYGLTIDPVFTAMLRDIFIIVLALVTVVIGLFLVVLIFQLQSLIALLRDEIKPILDSANQTVSTVRGTTTFVSDAVVTPLIQVAGYAAAVRQTVKTLAGGGRKKRRVPRVSQEQ